MIAEGTMPLAVWVVGGALALALGWWVPEIGIGIGALALVGAGAWVGGRIVGRRRMTPRIAVSRLVVARAGADYIALVLACAGEAAAAAARDGFGGPRSYRYSCGGREIEVDESIAASGQILRIARAAGQTPREVLEGEAIRASEGVLALRRRAQDEIVRGKVGADAANSAKTRFVATVSHELRTPMQGILGMTSLLLRTGVDATQREYLTALDKSGHLLLDLINDVLDASQIEEGTLHLNISDVDLIETMEGALAVLAARAYDKRLDLRLTIDPKVPRVIRADPLRLRQVLLNLVSDALKFTEQGSVSVKVAVVPANLPPSLVRLRFEIADAGLGAAASDRGRLLERFSQIDAGDLARSGGSGLGLSIARALVAQMDGAIGVESVPGEGSRFWFEILAGVIDEGGRPSAVEVKVDLSGLNVLIVEDNEVNQVVVEAFLADAGARSTVVEEGRAAVDAVSQGAFDLVLMDIHLPGMDGLTAAREIRALPGASPDAPKIIGMSADTHRIEAQAIRAGMNAWVAKPFSRDAFLSTVARVVGRGA